MRFVKETNIDDYADRIKASLQCEYNKMCSMLKFCKNEINEDAMRAGVNEYQARKYEVECIAQMLGFDLDYKGE